MQAHRSACILEHSGTFCMHSVTFCIHSGTFCMYSGTFWNILHAFWNILHVFWNILHAFWNILEHSECILNVFLNILHSFWNFLENSGTFWNCPEHSGTFWNILYRLHNVIGTQTHGHTDRRTEDIRTCWAASSQLKNFLRKTTNKHFYAKGFIFYLPSALSCCLWAAHTIVW